MNVFRSAVMIRSVKCNGRPSHSADMRIEIGNTIVSLIYGEDADPALNLILVDLFITQVYIRSGYIWLSLGESTKHTWSC